MDERVERRPAQRTRVDRRRRLRTGGMLDYAAWHARLAGTGPEVPPTETASEPIAELNPSNRPAHLAGAERRAA